LRSPAGSELAAPRNFRSGGTVNDVQPVPALSTKFFDDLSATARTHTDMNRITVIASVVAAAGAAHAQAPSPVAPTTQFYEQRVSEELATEGIVLSRQGFRLQIEDVGGKLLMSIVETATGRVAASTKVDSVPADGEPAVAMLTQVAADLMNQIAGRTGGVPIQAPSSAATDAKAREVADLKFKREAIRFGSDYTLFVNSSGGFTSVAMHGSWVTYQGDLDQYLAPDQFYTEVGRPDLAEEYHHRHRVVITGLVIGAAAFAASFAYTGYWLSQPDPCNQPAPGPSCGSSNVLLVALIGGGIGAIGITVAGWYHFHPHPISEDEAKSLADAYNQHLRVELGLPVVRSEPRVRDLQLAPVATANDYGVALAGRF
jgi:hypothetical protein